MCQIKRTSRKKFQLSIYIYILNNYAIIKRGYIRDEQNKLNEYTILLIICN